MILEILTPLVGNNTVNVIVKYSRKHLGRHHLFDGKKARLDHSFDTHQGEPADYTYVEVGSEKALFDSFF